MAQELKPAACTHAAGQGEGPSATAGFLGWLARLLGAQLLAHRGSTVQNCWAACTLLSSCQGLREWMLRDASLIGSGKGRKELAGGPPPPSGDALAVLAAGHLGCAWDGMGGSRCSSGSAYEKGKFWGGASQQPLSANKGRCH